MPSGDIIPLVAGDGVAVEPVNTNFTNLQNTVKAMPVANLAHNRTPFEVTALHEASIANATHDLIVVYLRNTDGLEGWRLNSLQAHFLAGGAIVNPNALTVVAEKCSTAAFAAGVVTMATLSVGSTDTAEAGNFYYDQVQPAVANETVPDSWFFRLRLSNDSGQAVTYTYVSAHFDMLLKPKA